MLKKFIGDRAIYRRFLLVAIPIIIHMLKKIRNAQEAFEAQQAQEAIQAATN